VFKTPGGGEFSGFQGPRDGVVQGRFSILKMALFGPIHFPNEGEQAPKNESGQFLYPDFS